MNGDLLNNNNLVTETKKNTKFKISDPKCSNDLYGLKDKLEKNKKLDLKSFQGSLFLSITNLRILLKLQF